MVEPLLRGDDDATRYLKKCSVYVLPMANKDGVAGAGRISTCVARTWNRNWDEPGGPPLLAGNHALETWLEAMITGKRQQAWPWNSTDDGNGEASTSARSP